MQAQKQYLEVLNLSRILALSGEYREARCNKLLKVLGKWNHEKAMESVSRIFRVKPEFQKFQPVPNMPLTKMHSGNE